MLRGPQNEPIFETPEERFELLPPGIELRNANVVLGPQGEVLVQNKEQRDGNGS